MQEIILEVSDWFEQGDADRILIQKAGIKIEEKFFP